MQDDKKYGIKEEVEFDSIEKAGNYIKDLKDIIKRKTAASELPINTATEDERVAYLRYCISMVTKENLPFVKETSRRKCVAVLQLVAMGYTHQAIVGWLHRNKFGNVTEEQVKQCEKDGLDMVKSAIGRVQNTKKPLVGGI